MLRGAGGHCELGEGKGAAWGRVVYLPILPQGVLGGVGGHRDQLHRMVLGWIACHSEPEGDLGGPVLSSTLPQRTPGGFCGHLMI